MLARPHRLQGEINTTCRHRVDRTFYMSPVSKS